MKLLLYCTKAKPYLKKYWFNGDNGSGFNYETSYCQDEEKECEEKLNGKIVAKCEFNIDKIEYKHIKERDKFGILHNECWYEYKGVNVCHYNCDLASRSGFKDDSSLFDYLSDYLVDKDGKTIHISNLNVFDKAKELNEVYKIEDVGGMLFTKPLTKTPRNMMRVSVNHWNYATYNPNDIRIIIPISSQEACNILNGKQDMLIRKNVLKEML